MSSKAKSQILHARMRIRERFDLDLKDDEMQSLANRIKKSYLDKHKGKAQFVDRQSLRVSRWFVWFREQWFPVVYDNNRKTIVTVLPKGALGPEPEPLTE